MSTTDKPSTTRRVDELNALEEAEAEQVAGTSILALESEHAPKAKLLAAMAWVHKRRTEPKLKYTDYLKSSKSKDNINYLFGSDAEDAEEDAEDADQVEPDPSARVLDDEGEPTDPFPEAADPEGTAGAPGGVADTEGAVLPLDRRTAG